LNFSLLSALWSSSAICLVRSASIKRKFVLSLSGIREISFCIFNAWFTKVNCLLILSISVSVFASKSLLYKKDFLPCKSMSWYCHPWPVVFRFPIIAFRWSFNQYAIVFGNAPFLKTSLVEILALCYKFLYCWNKMSFCFAL